METISEQRMKKIERTTAKYTEKHNKMEKTKRFLKIEIPKTKMK